MATETRKTAPTLPSIVVLKPTGWAIRLSLSEPQPKRRPDGCRTLTVQAKLHTGTGHAILARSRPWLHVVIQWGVTIGLSIWAAMADRGNSRANTGNAGHPRAGSPLDEIERLQGCRRRIRFAVYDGVRRVVIPV